MTLSERLKGHKIPFLLQFHVPNRETHPEEYAHYILFIYLSFRNEIKMKHGELPCYTGKLGTPGVIDIIIINRSLIEPFTDIVDNAFE